jgi:chorismate lyase / 3-hydroxybenzoate synthase
VLAVFGFGAAAAAHQDDPRYLRVALQPYGAAPLEVWRVAAPVHCGRDDGLARAENGALLFGALELDEPPHSLDSYGDIETAATVAYRRLSRATAARGYPRLLRVWNYLDGITEGEGDGERYRRFCVGRAEGWLRSTWPGFRQGPRSAAATPHGGRRSTGWPRARPIGHWRIRARSVRTDTRARTVRGRRVSRGRCCRPWVRRC